MKTAALPPPGPTLSEPDWSWCDEDWADQRIATDLRSSPEQRRRAEERIAMREILRDQLRRAKGDFRRGY
jgi:hypothetical protein